ncbi:carboxypeptidase-like regulatory domain-containing protein [Hymenobacter agri]
MKPLVFLLAFISAQQSYAQSTGLIGTVKDTESGRGFPAATLLFKQGETTITGAATDSAGYFRVVSIGPGTYDIEIRALGFRTKRMPGVVVSPAAIPLALSFPGPCEFQYAERQRPACVGGHTDHLLPIVYGLLSKRAMARAKAGKIYLGGCQVTGCDPRYYCPIHQKEV